MGRIQMLWPLTSDWYGYTIDVRSFTNISIEWASFLLAMLVLTKTNDLRLLFKSGKSNLLLIVPSGAIFVSSIIGARAIGLSQIAPTELLIPHLIFLTVFTFSIMKFLSKKTL